MAADRAHLVAAGRAGDDRLVELAEWPRDPPAYRQEHHPADDRADLVRGTLRHAAALVLHVRDVRSETAAQGALLYSPLRAEERPAAAPAPHRACEAPHADPEQARVSPALPPGRHSHRAGRCSL